MICSNEIIFSFPRFSLLSCVMKSHISFLSILLQRGAQTASRSTQRRPGRLAPGVQHRACQAPFPSGADRSLGGRWAPCGVLRAVAGVPASWWVFPFSFSCHAGTLGSKARSLARDVYTFPAANRHPHGVPSPPTPTLDRRGGSLAPSPTAGLASGTRPSEH